MEPYDHLPAEEPVSVTSRVTTTRSKRYLVTAGVLAGGVALGALFSPIGLAGAQDGGSGTSAAGSDGGGTPTTAAGTADTQGGTDSSTDDKRAGGKDSDGGHMGRGHHGSGTHTDELASVLGLTSDELWTQLGSGKSLGEIADAQGVSRDTVIDTLTNDLADHLADAVADGRITQAEADTKLAEAKDGLREMIDKGWDDWADGWGGGRDHGWGGWGHGWDDDDGNDDDDSATTPGAGSHRGWGWGDHGDELQATADSLGIDLDQLWTDVWGGKTIAEAAQAQGVGADKLTEALEAKAIEHIDEDLAAGRITQARADELKADLDTRIADLINGQVGGGWGDHWGDRGHHGTDGGGSDNSGSGDTQQSSFQA